MKTQKLLLYGGLAYIGYNLFLKKDSPVAPVKPPGGGGGGSGGGGGGYTPFTPGADNVSAGQGKKKPIINVEQREANFSENKVVEAGQGKNTDPNARIQTRDTVQRVSPEVFTSIMEGKLDALKPALRIMKLDGEARVPVIVQSLLPETIKKDSPLLPSNIKAQVLSVVNKKQI